MEINLKKLMAKNLVICSVFYLIVFNAESQTSYMVQDASLDYSQVLQYLNEKQYGQAYYHCQKILGNQHHYTDSKRQLEVEDAKYYSVFLAAKLGMSDAEGRIKSYYQAIQGARKHQLAFHLAEFYFGKGNFIEAENYLELAGEENLPKEWLDAFYFKSGYALYENGKSDKAIRFLEKASLVKKSVYANDARYYLGTIYFNQKRYGEAETYLESISHAAGSKDVNFVLAQIQYLKKNYQRAIELIRNDQSNAIGKQGLLGKCHFELAQYDEAYQALQRHISENQKVNAEDMYQLAFSEYKIGKYSEAIGHFKELQLSNHFGQYAMYALADCYLKLKDKNNALIGFLQASQGDQDAVIKEESKYLVAKLQYDLKLYNEATKTLSDFSKEYPNSKYNDEALSLMTSSLLFTNNYPQAIDIIEKNPKIQNGNERLYQEICYTYAIQLYQSGNKEASTQYLKKSILNPFDKPIEAEARYLRAEIYFKEGEYSKAQSEYNEVFKLLQKEKILFAQNATLFNTHYGLAYCAYHSKDYGEALAQFQKATSNYKFTQNQPKSDVMQDVDLRMADIYFIQKNYDAAYNQYSKISQSRGRGYDYATLQKANIDGVKKNYKDKIATLTKLLREVPNSIYFNDAKYQLGLANEDHNNQDEALRVYADIELKSNSQEYIPKALIRQATIFYNRQNFKDALGKYGKIIEQYGNSPEADQALKAIKEIYLAEGKAEEFIEYVNRLPNGRQIQASEQDTILFESAESAYAEGNCEMAINQLGKYLDRFPNGLFQAKAHFYKAECYAKKKLYIEALEEYTHLSLENNHPYYERALVKSAYYSYNVQKDFSKSKTFYQKLQAIASTVQNKQVAKIGLLESNYNLKNYNEVIDIAKLIESEQEINVDIRNEAIYYRGKANYFQKNYSQAIPILEAIIKDKTYKHSAECTYYLASIHHLQNNFKKSNEILLAAKDDYGSYESWIIKYFILIGYNYHKLGDNFQAKATLESIISNYQGDANLVEEAKSKLAEINSKMKESSKVKYK